MPLVLRTKCIVVGESTVGKTALIKSVQSDGKHFTKNYIMTTGVDISVKSVRIPDTDVIVEFYIYDSSGKEIYTEFVQKFWEHPSVVMVVYDVTNTQSFQSCAKWLERVKAKKSAPELILPGVLVANKIDLNQRRVISDEEGQLFANNKELRYCDCSVKEYENTEKPFHYLAEEFYKIYESKTQQLQSLC